MIRVDDPTVVVVKMPVRDALLLQSIVQDASSACVGIVFNEEQKRVWDEFRSQCERASHIQRSIHAQLYAGPAAVPHVLPALSAPAQMNFWQRLQWRMFGGGGA